MAHANTQTLVRPKWQRSILRFFGGTASIVGALIATAALFCVLPVINRIAGGERRYDVTPMPDEFTPEEEEIIEEPEEEEPEEEEPEEEPPPPELQEEIQEVSLAQLEGILNSGGGIGVGPAEFSVKGLAQAAGADIANLEMNSFGDRPRPRSQPQPDLTGPERKATPGRATVRFAVDVNGRVQDVSLHEATHPLLGRAAVRTIKKWRFYPAMRDGKPVRKAVSQTIEFQKQ